jgi:hypothetical protein
VDEAIIKTLGGMGVGGVLAGIILTFYRQDRTASENKFAQLGHDFREIVTNNTEALTAVKTLIETKLK